jgi:hypothetical protein
MKLSLGKYLSICLMLASGFRLQAASCEVPVDNSTLSTLNSELLTSDFPALLSSRQLLTSNAREILTPHNCLLLTAYCLLPLHPVHISVTEINYSEKDKALQITSRLFIDDLELSIRAKRREPELDIMEPKAPLTTQQLVTDYLIEHFKVKLDGKPCKLKFLGVEKEDLSLICYIEIENVKKVKTLEVFNDAIMGTHEDQSNLVHVTFKSPVKSARLVYNKPSEKFVFEKK